MESRKTAKLRVKVKLHKNANNLQKPTELQMGRAAAVANMGEGLLQKIPFTGFGLISPAFLYALLLAIVPLSTLVVVSFWQQPSLGVYEKTWDLRNYIAVFQDDLFFPLILRTIFIAGLVTLATILLSFPAAYYISFYGGAHKNTWLFLITLPFWSSYLLRVFSWKIVLGYGGVLDSAWISVVGLFVAPENLENWHLTFLIYNINSVVITLAHAYAPFAILPIFISLEKIDRNLLEAAHDLGDKAWQSFFRITLPLCFTGIIGAAVIVFIPTMGDYVTPKMVGGAEGIMISNQIECMFKTCANWPMGSTLAILTMLGGLIALLIFIFGMRFIFTRIK